MNIAMTRYWIIFAAIYAGAMVIANVLAHVFLIDLGTGANIGMLFAAGYGSAIKFVTDNKRVPDTIEKRKLVFGSLLISWLISGAGLVLLIALLGNTASTELITLFRGVPTIFWVLIVLGVSLLYYLLLSFIYGWGAKKYAEKALRGTVT